MSSYDDIRVIGDINKFSLLILRSYGVFMQVNKGTEEKATLDTTR